MVKYTSASQLAFEEFQTPFEQGLDKTNRWVRLAGYIPWDELARIYVKSLRDDFGRPAVDARVVIGALIIKHKKRLTDEETIEEIRENPYLQFFLGLKGFAHQRVFDPSLFVTLRKRMGSDVFDQMSQAFMAKIASSERKKNQKNNVKASKTSSSDTPAPQPKDKPTAQGKPDNNKGKLLVDATVAPQDIKYPTDLDLLNTSREKTEKIIDELYLPEPGKRKVRTYRVNARKAYLATVRNKKKSAKVLRKAIRKQLNYLNRNIKTIGNLLDSNQNKIPYPLLRDYWVAQEIYRQQQEMYDNHSHQISDRIVSFSQPHIRPIVRGKAGKDTEFGAKISASLVNGFAHLDRISWDAYNESGDLIPQVESYYERYGFYPEIVITDKIYGNKKNREYLKSKGIRYSGKPLGRPPELTRHEKRQLKREAGFRSRIEGKFGEGKRKYDLGLVKTKTMDTSESWIAAVFFVMNLAHWLRLDFFALFFKPIFSWIFDNFKELFVCRSTSAPNLGHIRSTFSGNLN